MRRRAQDVPKGRVQVKGRQSRHEHYADDEEMKSCVRPGSQPHDCLLVKQAATLLG